MVMQNFNFIILLLFGSFLALKTSANEKVLYNSTSHQVVTPDQIRAGGTEWVILDANNSNYASYTHPAYYNTTVHQVLDSSQGSSAGNWILTQSSGNNSQNSAGGSESNATESSKVLYNSTSHQVVTPDQIRAGGTEWVILDASNSNYSNYTHPAYYNTSTHQVLDSSQGSSAGNWILTQSSSGGGSYHATLVEKISNPIPENSGYFGMFLSRDGNWLVAGSKNADVFFGGSNITDAGKVHIYQVNERNGTAQLKHSFHAPYPVEGDGFGYRVFLKDGKLAIGSPPANLNTSLAGGIAPDFDSGNPRSVFVYKIDANGTATYEQTIAAPDGMTARDSFGLNVHIAGDILTVGGVDYQSGSDPEGNATSRVYRYKLESNNTATLIQRITLQENAYDHNGVISFSQLGNRFVVGNYDYEGTNSTGRVSVFSIDQEDQLTPIQTVNAPLYSSGYGRAMHQSGNLLVIGAYKEGLEVDESTYLPYVGAVYIYKFDQNGTANLIQRILPYDQLEKSKFGRSVLIKEDDNGSGTLLVGAYYQGSGVIYSYKISNEGLTEFTEKITPSGAMNGDYFGISQTSVGEYFHFGANKTGYADFNKSGAFYTYKIDLPSGNSKKSIYNAVTQEAVSAELATKTNTSPWSLLDSNRQEYSNLHHPAYYNSTLHQVLDSKEGSEASGWVLTSFASGANQPYTQIQESNQTQSNLVLYNQDTKELLTPEDIAAGGTDWLLLSPERYPDKYQHPAYYTLKLHFVVDNDNNVTNGWILIDPNKIQSEEDKVLYNKSTHQVITRTQVLANETDWIGLGPSTDINGTKYYVSQTGNRYLFPAYYHSSLHQVLDNSEGSQVGDWILTNPSGSTKSFTISLTAGNGGSASGGGSVQENGTTTITASASKGYVFVDWSGGATGSQNPKTITVTTDLNINANFSKDNRDEDGDGLSNYDELVTYDTNMSNPDSDGDGLSDKDELENGMDPKTSDKVMVEKVSQILGIKPANATPYTDGWFYFPNHGWLYTRTSIYPYFYDQSTKGWMYFQSGNENPRFYHYESQKWMHLGSNE